MNENWITIDDNFINRPEHLNITTEDLLLYFDGRPPGWAEIIGGNLPNRTIVDTILHYLTKVPHNSSLGRLLLVHGPSGEGKSTALMQVAVALAAQDDARVLWRAMGGQFAHSDIAKLPSGFNYYFISDDAEEIAKEVYESAARSRRRDVTFVLAARNVDWASVGAKAFPWRSVIGYKEAPLNGLLKSDADLLVSAWGRYGRSGLKELADLPAPERAPALLAAAHDNATIDGGALLGGMLKVRYGDHLPDRIRSLLASLATRTVGQGQTLTSALLYIAATHSIDLSLTPNVLADILQIDRNSIHSLVILPLQDEAVVSPKRSMLRTRHQLISNAVLQVAIDFNADLSETFASITRSAIRVGDKEFIPEYEKFAQLCRKIEYDHPQASIESARTAVDEAPKMISYVHNLAHVLRINDQSDEASRICEQAAKRIHRFRGKGHNFRAFYFEWASVERAENNIVLDAWLSAFSLSDREGFSPPDEKHSEMALHSIGKAFVSLLPHDLHDAEYKNAAQAVVQLGARIKLSNTAYPKFRSLRHTTSTWGLADMPASECIDAIKVALTTAWGGRERDLLGVSPPSALSFRGLASVLTPVAHSR